jgi:cardiolipin synthase
VLAAIIALTVRDITPLWLAIALVARDVVLLPTIPLLRRHGYGPLPVHFVGKAGTFALLYALPLLLLADGHGTATTIARPFAWAFTAWGVALYWLAGWFYVVQTRQVLAAERNAERGAVA